MGSPGFVAVVTHEAPDQVAVLLFHIATIVLPVGTGFGEGDLLLAAVVE